MQILALYPKLIAGGTQQTLRFPGALVTLYNSGLVVLEENSSDLRVSHSTKIKCWQYLFRLCDFGQLTISLWLLSFKYISQEGKC